MNAWKIGLVSALLLWTTACELSDSPEPVPAYLHIPGFELEPTPGLQHGSLTQKITHAKVFVRTPGSTEKSLALGMLNLPITVPVLKTGPVEVQLIPAIKANGSSLSVREYPFYEQALLQTTLEAAEVDTIRPKTRYKSDSVFEFIEDFDDPDNTHQFSDDLDGDPTHTLTVTTQDALEGRGSGLFLLDGDHPLAIVATERIFELDRSTQLATYVELDYRNDVHLEVGFFDIINGVEIPDFAFVIRPREEWNKIYLDLTDFILQQPNNPRTFRLALRAIQPLEDSTQTSRVLIDNVKLLHF